MLTSYSFLFIILDDISNPPCLIVSLSQSSAGSKLHFHGQDWCCLLSVLLSGSGLGQLTSQSLLTFVSIVVSLPAHVKYSEIYFTHFAKIHIVILQLTVQSFYSYGVKCFNCS